LRNEWGLRSIPPVIAASVSQRTILSERTVDLVVAPMPSIARAYHDSVPAVVTPSSLVLMKLFQVAPLFVKSWLNRRYTEAPGFLTQSWMALTPSPSVALVVRPVPNATVQVPVPSGFVLIVATFECGWVVKRGPGFGVGVGLGVGFAVAVAVAVAVGVAVAGTAVGPGVAVAAATAHSAIGREELSARRLTVAAGTQPLWSAGPGT
jgi:hypothetical protein